MMWKIKHSNVKILPLFFQGTPLPSRRDREDRRREKRRRNATGIEGGGGEGAKASNGSFRFLVRLRRAWLLLKVVKTLLESIIL